MFHPEPSAMRTLIEIATKVPKSLKDNPLGAMALVCCASYVLVAFLVYQLR